MKKKEELNEVLKGTQKEIQDIISKQPPGPLFGECSCPSLEESMDLMKNYGYQITCSWCRKQMEFKEDLSGCIMELKSVVGGLTECIKGLKSDIKLILNTE